MLHLTKLAVGARDIEHLRAWQAERAAQQPPLRHRTRHFPRRAAEVIDGGSIYWVVSGATLVRQRVLDIVEDHWDDGSRCSAIILDPALLMVAGRPTKPFQGWRYLSPGDAPPDLVWGEASDGEAALPTTLRQELRALCLI
jgi:hypothetical protein